MNVFSDPNDIGNEHLRRAAIMAMERFDTLPRLFRDLANEYGLAPVEMFMRYSNDPNEVRRLCDGLRFHNDPTRK